MSTRKKNALLIIDPQNDFCNPGTQTGSQQGSLYVPGAEEDMDKLSQFVLNNIQNIDNISVTLDSHHFNDIAHPSFWVDKDGNHPVPMTNISSDDVKNGKWTPRFDPQRCLKYLEDLEAQGEFPHTIWPTHCVIGSEGHAIYKPISDALQEWARNHWIVQTFTKGTYPFTEHFGAFAAQIPDPNRPETQFNHRIVKSLEEYQNVYFAGEAKTHCVASTLKQALDEVPQLAQKLVILEDCMSPVPGFEDMVKPIYDRARSEGIRFSTTDQEDLVGSQTASV